MRADAEARTHGNGSDPSGAASVLREMPGLADTGALDRPEPPIHRGPEASDEPEVSERVLLPMDKMKKALMFLITFLALPVMVAIIIFVTALTMSARILTAIAPEGKK